MTFQTKIREQEVKNRSFKKWIFFSSWFYWKTINIGWTPLDVLRPEPLNTKCYSSRASKRIFCHKLSFRKARSSSDHCQKPCQKSTSMKARLHYFMTAATPQASVHKAEAHVSIESCKTQQRQQQREKTDGADSGKEWFSPWYGIPLRRCLHAAAYSPAACFMKKKIHIAFTAALCWYPLDHKLVEI